MKKIVFKQNSHFDFTHNGITFRCYHNRFGYYVGYFVENEKHPSLPDLWPVFKGRYDTRKTLKNVNKYMKEFDVEFIEPNE